MSPINSRRKGAEAEREFIRLHLAEYWPSACRNLEQCRSDDKRDVANVAGCHFQIKRREKLNVWEALAQAEGEARDGDLPVVAFRRNRSRWYCVLEADELIALLRLRETA